MALGKNSERLHTKHLGAVPITGMRDPVEIWAVIDKL
jgi:hypothetical protein